MPCPAEVLEEGATKGSRNGLVETVSSPSEGTPLLKAKNGILGATYNCITLIIGGAPTTVPYIMKDAGTVWGLSLLLIVALITDYTTTTLIRCGHIIGVFSYHGVVESVFGRLGYYILALLQFAYMFAGCVSVNVLIGDSVPKLLFYFISVHGVSVEESDLYRDLIVLGITLLITLPLSLYKSVGKLAKWSFISIVTGCFVIITMAVRLGDMNVPETKDAWRSVDLGGTLSAMGICAFSFVYHPAAFPVYESLTDRSERRWGIVTHLTVGGSFILCTAISLIGYATFTGYTQGDILMNYCAKDILMNSARIVFSFSVLLSYPLYSVVCREIVEDLWCKDPTNVHHVLITGAIVASAYFISVATQCMDFVSALGGIITAVPVGYILPPICYIKLESGPWYCWKKIPALLTLGIGLIVGTSGIVGLTTKCSHAPELPYCSGNSTGSF